MSSTETYDVAFVCPECQAFGTVRVTENDGYAFVRYGAERVLSDVSSGFFKGEVGPKGTQIICDTCRVPVRETGDTSQTLSL